MTPTRKRRLLILAGKPIDHKPYYSQYLQLIDDGLCGWVNGWAWRTDAGDRWLRDNER
ncbi:hypothetical protein Q0601_00950 [Paracoccus onubensis]|uniref:hypothetical protein n=1 Tax=Paracoccus onubensis TaxID=1675788 RepID=UPI00273037CB|nr:hypothetical protein [Paracoccus onubensis]MDP0925730.1 hypothetical protein [Paracoccus onubensis]